MAQRYQNVMVAIDGSKEADLARQRCLHCSTQRIQAHHCSCYRHTRSSKRVTLMLKFTRTPSRC